MKKGKRSGRGVPTVEELYQRLFVPTPCPQWRNDNENFSLEQPSILKWVPSETTYGVGVILRRKSNA
jgi:hypothetical protein